MCNDERWFHSIVYFPTRVILSEKQNVEPVLGIGTVFLPVKKSNDPGDNSAGFLVLKDVLYCPTSSYNFLGPLPGYYVPGGFSEPYFGGRIFQEGKVVACFDPESSAQRVMLSQPPPGQTLAPSSRPLRPYCAVWTKTEQERWVIHKQAIGLPQEHHERPAQPPYTAEERKWLQKNCGSELEFLSLYKLDIRSEKDRDEGRAKLRDMMAKKHEITIVEPFPEQEDTDEEDMGFEIVDETRVIDVGYELLEAPVFEEMEYEWI